MRKIFHLFLFCLLAACAGAALAQDEPCEDDIGVALGLCTAYCDGTRCDCSYEPDCEPRASATGCRNVYISYTVATGAALTCRNDVCPCLDISGWPSGNPTWIRLATGFFPTTCFEQTGNTTTLKIPPISIGGEEATVVVNGNQSSCSLSVDIPEPNTTDTFRVPLSADEAKLNRGRTPL